MIIENSILPSEYSPTPNLNKLYITASQYNNLNMLSFYTLSFKPERHESDIGVWHVKKNKK